MPPQKSWSSHPHVFCGSKYTCYWPIEPRFMAVWCSRCPLRRNLSFCSIEFYFFVIINQIYKGFIIGIGCFFIKPGTIMDGFRFCFFPFYEFVMSVSFMSLILKLKHDATRIERKFFKLWSLLSWNTCLVWLNTEWLLFLVRMITFFCCLGLSSITYYWFCLC